MARKFKTMGGGIGGSQGARVQRAVDGAGSAGLRLHLNDLYGVAKNVLLRYLLPAP